MKKPLTECVTPETTQQQRIFSHPERDSVAYFFLRLSNIYLAEYIRHLHNAESENLAKREFGTRVCKYSRQQIDKGCSWIHQQKENHTDGWQYLDIDRCIGAVKEANTVKAIHRPFERDLALEDKGAQERAKSAGERELGGLKAIFEPTSTRDTTIEQDLTDKRWAE
jgi:hypothetical protein